MTCILVSNVYLSIDARLVVQGGVLHLISENHQCAFTHCKSQMGGGLVLTYFQDMSALTNVTRIKFSKYFEVQLSG